LKRTAILIIIIIIIIITTTTTTTTIIITTTIMVIISLNHMYYTYVSRDSPVGMALGYGLDDRGCRVRFLEGSGHFSLHHRFQNGSGAHPASYPMGTRGSFPGGKAADV
jgi:hypothetical protein